MKKSANSFAKVSSSSCLGSGLLDVVPVKCLTSEYNFWCCFHIQLSDFLMSLCLVVLSMILYFSHSPWSAVQWWCCLYFLHVFSLFLTTCFCHFTLSEYHGFFGLVTIVSDIVGAYLFSVSLSVVSYKSTIWFPSSICDIISMSWRSKMNVSISISCSFLYWMVLINCIFLWCWEDAFHCCMVWWVKWFWTAYDFTVAKGFSVDMVQYVTTFMGGEVYVLV